MLWHRGRICGVESAGWQAAWLSEIEPFPCAVLKYHYPDVPNLGDMTKLPERILSDEVEAPDIFCGGTPCQAFSVAGLRNSLDDARGNLSLTFVGIANAIDHVRSVRGDDPAIIFWENVPGVLSTKDNAFGCFLGALAGEDEPLQPAGGKWTDAGVVLGPQRAVAWRILDAQYFSLAQRRRRVFVISSARDDFDPAAVLLEWEGVRRDIAPCREARETTSHATAPCLTSSGRGVERTGDTRGQDPVVAQPMVLMDQGAQTYSTPAIGHIVHDDVASTITKNTGGGGETQNPAFVAQPMVLMDQGGSVMNVEHDMVGTLRRETHGHELVVMQPIPLDLRNAGRDPEKHDEMNRQGVGVGTPGEPAHTVTSAFVHGVAQPIHYRKSRRAQSTTDHETWVEDDAANTLNCFDVGDIRATDVVAQPVAVGTDCYNGSITGDVACTMGTPGSSINASGPTVMVGAFKSGQSAAARSVGYETEMAPSLEAGGGGNNKPAIHVGMQVRRLTPVECERLQGFPDNYTAIPWRKKPAGECPDGPRYKALGNSWAVPNVRWIGQRIADQINKKTS